MPDGLTGVDALLARFPRLAETEYAVRWLRHLSDLQRDSKTVLAYAAAVADWLAFLDRLDTAVEAADEETAAQYVADLKKRPGRRGIRIDSGSGLSIATMRLRLTAIRLWYEYLKRRGRAFQQPMPAGEWRPELGSTHGASDGGRDSEVGRRAGRGLLPTQHYLPWIPTQDEWQRFLDAACDESQRTRLMLLVAYEGALRRETVVGLDVRDLDPAHRTITVRPDIVKGGRGGVVGYSAVTGRLLVPYLMAHHARIAGLPRGARRPLFTSESNLNRGDSLSPDGWHDIVTRIAARADLPQLHPHTLRHLRLTDMARAGMELYEIQQWAMHTDPATTLRYIHLSGRHLNQKVAKQLAFLDEALARVADALNTGMRPASVGAASA